MNKSDFNFYRDVRNSKECQCGHSKPPGFYLCYICYSKLPVYLKTSLIKFTNDSMEAYDEAVELLTE